MSNKRYSESYEEDFIQNSDTLDLAKYKKERISSFVGGLCFTIIFACFVRDGTAATSLVSHKANYTLTMGAKSQNALVQNVRGKISFELRSECDGWYLSEDYLFQFLYESGEEITILSHSDSWEDSEGQLYSFDVREQNSYEPESLYTGFAKLPSESEIGEASYAGTYDDNLLLSDDILFPVTYTRAIIDAAEMGKKFMSKQLFVNSTPEDALKTASAAIGNRKPYKSDIQIEGVTTSHYWPIDIAYFKMDATQATPEYQIQMDLHDNGVVTNFLIDYGEFSIHANISDGNLLDNPDCS